MGNYEQQNTQRILDVQHLRTSFFTAKGEVKAVNDVSYYVNKGEIVAIVGESGCGKSVTQLSVVQLVQSPPGKILSGKVYFNGENLLDYSSSSSKMRSIRGAGISMIFQEPMTSLDPVITVGNQLIEVIRTHKKVDRKTARQMAIEALASVDIPDPAERIKNYPFEMSGGMRQRVMIATAVACESKLIIADEPTTALDVTTQAQVMELLSGIVRSKNTALLIITHNLGLVSRYADRIYVMYAGHIVESGSTRELLTYPRHPYTKGLMQAVPGLDDDKEKNLIPIPGSPPNLAKQPDSCPFYPRCPYAQEICKTAACPTLRDIGAGHCVACHLDFQEAHQ